MKPEEIKDLTSWMRRNGAMQFAVGPDSMSVVFATKAVTIPGKPAPLPEPKGLLEDSVDDMIISSLPQGGDPIYDSDVS